VSNQQGLKVLSHEDESLKNGLSAEIAGIKREYYRICLRLMEDLRRDRSLDFNARTAVMSLFGMINWIYTWYNPRVDGNAEVLAEQMGNIVLYGIGIVHGGKARKKSQNFHPDPERSRRGGSGVRRRQHTPGHN
jgi:hypothetical protein